MFRRVEFIEEDIPGESQSVQGRETEKGFIYSLLSKLGIRGIVAHVLLVFCITSFIAIAVFNIFQAQQTDKYGLFNTEVRSHS